MIKINEFYRRKTAFLGLILVFGISLMALFAPQLSSYDPYQVDIQNTVAPPSLVHFFGTDDLGRDLFARIIFGARISLIVGVLGMLVSLCIGTALGTLAGYYGGWVDQSLMRLTDMLLAFPALLFIIAVMAIFEEPSVAKIFLVLGVIGWPAMARLLRAQIMSLKEQDFVVAAKASGLRPFRLIFFHLFPNALSPLIVTSTLSIAGNILSEAWLSFLGLGAQPPLPSWGSMITQGQAYLQSHPWVCVFPGLAIFLTVMGFNLLGDGLRDILDPKLKR